MPSQILVHARAHVTGETDRLAGQAPVRYLGGAPVGHDPADRAEVVAASMDELGAGMTELAGQVSALAGFGRTLAGTVVSGPVGRAAAVGYGVWHAVGLRRGGRRALPGEVVK